VSCHSDEFRLFLFVLYIIVRDFWEQLSIKSLQVDSYSHISICSGIWRTLQREKYTEAFPPQDCIRTVGNGFGGAEAASLLWFR